MRAPAPQASAMMENQIRRNKIQIFRNKIQAEWNKFQIRRNEIQMKSLIFLRRIKPFQYNDLRHPQGLL